MAKGIDMTDMAGLMKEIAQEAAKAALAAVGKVGSGGKAVKTKAKVNFTAEQVWTGALNADGLCLRDVVEAVWDQSEKDFPNYTAKCFTSEYGKKGERADSPQNVFRDAARAIREKLGIDKASLSGILEDAGYIQQGKAFSKEPDEITGKKKVYFYWARPGVNLQRKASTFGFELKL